MKKIFALFLACALLFLTACNKTPPIEGSSNEDAGNSSVNWQDALQDQLVPGKHGAFIDLPSRVVFEATIDHEKMILYYSKADGKAYVYCFDPLCDHTDYTCLGNPASDLSDWYFSNAFFINDRFYSVNKHGKIHSFAFDGSDKKLEYDAGYEVEEHMGIVLSQPCWSVATAYGPYIYINSNQNLDAKEVYLLRFNTETKEMEDLTAKTGNYIHPHYFYNGMIYGDGDGRKTVDAFFKADLDLNTVERLEERYTMYQYGGTAMVGDVIKERESISEYPERIGASIYDIETGEKQFFTNEDWGLEEDPIFVCATDQYFYFYEPKKVALGTVVVETGSGPVERTSYKSNPGKLYRMDLDGSNIVCVYDNPEYELGRNAIICGDRILMMGKYMCIEDKKTKSWGGILQAATINPDGTIGEFEEVEIVA